jgi:NADPH2:quinone reductase
MVADLEDDVAAGRLQVLGDRTFQLAEAADAHAYLECRQAVGRGPPRPLSA